MQLKQQYINDLCWIKITSKTSLVNGTSWLCYERGWRSTYSHRLTDWGVFSWMMRCRNMFKGSRSVLDGFVSTVHEGACKTESQIPRPIGDLTCCSQKPDCIVITSPHTIGLNHNYNMRISILPRECRNAHLKYEYDAFAYYSNCYVTKCPLTMGIVASQCPPARDAVLGTRYPTPLILACLNPIKWFYHNKTYWWWIWKYHWRLYCCVWRQWFLQFPINYAND